MVVTKRSRNGLWTTETQVSRAQFGAEHVMNGACYWRPGGSSQHRLFWGEAEPEHPGLWGIPCLTSL